MTKDKKIIPKIGNKLYLSQKTGKFYTDSAKTPYTVVAVSPGSVVVQAARCRFPKLCYYDTLPAEILTDPTGEMVILHWCHQKKLWHIEVDGKDLYATFTEEYEYAPNLGLD